MDVYGGLDRTIQVGEGGSSCFARLLLACVESVLQLRLLAFLSTWTEDTVGHGLGSKHLPTHTHMHSTTISLIT